MAPGAAALPAEIEFVQPSFLHIGPSEPRHVQSGQAERDRLACALRLIQGRQQDRGKYAGEQGNPGDLVYLGLIESRN